VNLPRAQKWIDPQYQEIGAGAVTLLTSADAGALVRLIAGDIATRRGPGSTHSPMTMVHATVQPGARLVLPWPAEYNALVYILGGDATVGEERRPIHSGLVRALVLAACVSLLITILYAFHPASRRL